MAGLTDAQELQVQPAGIPDALLVLGGSGAKIRRHTIGHMGFGEVHIHPAEKVAIHVKAIRVLVLCRNTDILVEVEGTAGREIQPFVLVGGDEPVINPLHCAAGSQAEDEIGFGAQTGGDQPAGEVRGLIGARSNDNFHG